MERKITEQQRDKATLWMARYFRDVRLAFEQGKPMPEPPKGQERARKQAERYVDKLRENKQAKEQGRPVAEWARMPMEE